MTNPVQFELLFEIINEEVGRNDHNHSKSCTKGLLWLKRCVYMYPKAAVGGDTTVLCTATAGTQQAAVRCQGLLASASWAGCASIPAMSIPAKLH